MYSIICDTNQPTCGCSVHQSVYYFQLTATQHSLSALTSATCCVKRHRVNSHNSRVIWYKVLVIWHSFYFLKLLFLSRFPVKVFSSIIIGEIVQNMNLQLCAASLFCADVFICSTVQ